ncbi:MAG: hypothetical protein ACPGVD_10550 [Flavobacteriales bacterium]
MPKLNTKRIIYFAMILLLLIDTGYSFWQHQAKPLDGDMAWNSIPDSDVKPVLDNPLGIKAIVQDTTYVNPNRFFCHSFNQHYILNAPLFLQHYFSPINSVYFSMGIARTIIQILLLILLGMFISQSPKFWKWKGILAMFLTVSLFQTNGFNRQMGIVDESTTYAFFYALPLIFLLIYLFPFIYQVYFNKINQIPWVVKLLWIPLAFIVCLSGPLNPGIALVFALLAIIHQLIKLFKSDISVQKRPWLIFKKIPSAFYFYLTPLVILSLYSLFLGKYNSLTIESQISIPEMYGKMIQGIVPVFFEKLGLPILFIILIFNLIVLKIRKKKTEESKLLTLSNWVLAFCLLYILLLPFGGYREYRQYVMRNDTLLPVIYLLMFLFGITSLHLIHHLKRNFRKGYLLLMFGFIFFYTKSDNENFDKNECEKISLKIMANSIKDVVKLNENCAPLGWFLSQKPEESILQAKLIHHWNITNREILFYNSVDEE